MSDAQSAGIARTNGSGDFDAPPVIATMVKLFAELSQDTRLDPEMVVTRPHPLLVMARREELVVVFVPAIVWMRGRELLKPFTERLAAGNAMLVLVGHPGQLEMQAAINRGLASVITAAPSVDEVFLAGTRAFELLEAKSRAESRGKWLNRYRYELGELINIARAMTTERDVNKLLGVILEKCRFVTGAGASS